MRLQSPIHVLLLLIVLAATAQQCYCAGDEQSPSHSDDVSLQSRPRRPRRNRQLLRLRRWRQSDDSDDGAVGGDVQTKVKKGNKKRKKQSDQTTARSLAAHDDDSLNCTYLPPRRRRYRPKRRKQRLLTRKAYRMAVLAKLAYWDFRREDGTGNNTYTSFALSDDPFPPPQLQSSMDIVSWGKRDKSRRSMMPPHRLFAGLVVHFRLLSCRTRHILARVLRRLRRNTRTETIASSPDPRKKTKPKCQKSLLDRYEAGRRYQIEWTLQNWHEAALPKIKWHDTDLIIATSGASEVVLAFAGTASAADQFTNVQTFEPVSHSGLFGDGNNGTNSTISGSIHRGFLNAYSRVVRGTMLRLCDNDSVSVEGGNNNTVVDRRLRCKTSLTKSLHLRYDECITQGNKYADDITEEDEEESNILNDEDTNTNTTDEIHAQPSNSTSQSKWRSRFMRKGGNKQKKDKKKEKKRRSRRKLVGCQSHGEKLMDILREIVTDALEAGHTVHLSGHSLGGGISSLFALDIIMNIEEVPISKLNLWTFGAPEVADSAFYESAALASPRLHDFLRDRKRYHRFVTRADNCATDFVSTIASKGLNRRTARRIGGVRGNIIHPAEPAYIPLRAARSGFEGHYMQNYLKGISVESPDHPLATDFPTLMSDWLGEDIDQKYVVGSVSRTAR